MSRKKRNLLFFLTDALTFLGLGCYGNRQVKTPHIDELAASGAVFTNAYAMCPFCVPSRASLMTGLYPHHHGIVHNGCKADYFGEGEHVERMIVDADVTTDRTLAEAGYDTSFFGRFHLTDEYGPPSYYKNLYREMDPYRDRLNAYTASHDFPPGTEISEWYQWRLPTFPCDAVRRAPRHVNRKVPFLETLYEEFILKMGKLMLPHEECFDWIVADLSDREIRETKGNFAVTCSFGAPHDPWAAPEPYYSMYDPGRIELPSTFTISNPNPLLKDAGSFVYSAALGEAGLREYIRIYFAQLSFIDAQVGRLLAALKETGQWEDTVLVFTADHGDLVGHHGLFEKDGSQYFPDPLVHVPLLVCAPGAIEAGTRVDNMVQQIDVMPTLLDYCGFDIPGGIDGRSMRGLIENGESETWRPYALGQRSGLSRPYDRYSEVQRQQVSVQTHDWKCIFHGDTPFALIDRSREYERLENVLDRAPAGVLEKMREHMAEAWS